MNIIEPRPIEAIGELPMITIQSAHRPHHVPLMRAVLFPYEAIWYVPFEQVAAYREQGAQVRAVHGKLPMKPVQLNAALDDAFLQGKRVITMDDDFQGMQFVRWEGESGSATKVSLVQAIDALNRALDATPQFWLAGMTTTSNVLWSRPGIKNTGMITGQILAHDPSSIRFDERLGMLEDLDYIIAHHVQMHGICKLQDWLPLFHIFGRSESSDKKYEGGYKDYRTEELQARTLNYLARKWNHIPGVSFNDQGLGKSVQSKVRWSKVAQANPDTNANLLQLDLEG